MPDGSVFKDMAGAYVALMTPFTKKDTVNVAVLEQQVDYYAACGIRGLYVTGGTGEGLLLTLAERKHVLETVVRANAGRMRIIAHIGCINTNDAVTLARHAEKTGADWMYRWHRSISGRHSQPRIGTTPKSPQPRDCLF